MNSMDRRNFFKYCAGAAAAAVASLIPRPKPPAPELVFGLIDDPGRSIKDPIDLVDYHRQICLHFEGGLQNPTKITWYIDEKREGPDCGITFGRC